MSRKQIISLFKKKGFTFNKYLEENDGAVKPSSKTENGADPHHDGDRGGAGNLQHRAGDPRHPGDH